MLRDCSCDGLEAAKRRPIHPGPGLRNTPVRYQVPQRLFWRPSPVVVAVIVVVVVVVVVLVGVVVVVAVVVAVAVAVAVVVALALVAVAMAGLVVVVVVFVDNEAQSVPRMCGLRSRA